MGSGLETFWVVCCWGTWSRSGVTSKDTQPSPSKGISTQALTSSPVTVLASPSVAGSKPMTTRAGMLSERHMSIMSTEYCSSSPMRESASTMEAMRAAPCPGWEGLLVPSE